MCEIFALIKIYILLKNVKDHYCVAVYWKKFTYWYFVYWRTMFTDEANFFPSIMFGDVCGGKKGDLKTRNLIVVRHYG